MFYIIYNTSSKFICEACNDTSSPISESLQSRFASFTRLNKLNVNEYSVVELPYEEDLVIKIGRDMFNAETNTISADPNWVPLPPDPAPTPTEPTK
jgi:hypothetical protein